MQPWGKVSSIRGALTLFEGQQINGQTYREEAQTEGRNKGAIKRRTSRKIQAAAPKRK
jgi:hypothetical protein